MTLPQTKSRENAATAEDWRKALNKVVPAVVVLRTTACRAFDTEATGASYATGFVVDKRRGIILTNRHVARNFRFHCGLVYVAESGYLLYRAGVPRHAIIKKFAGEEIATLDNLISAPSKLHRGARVPLEYVSYMDRHRRKSVLVTMDHHEWYAPPQVYTRNDTDGLWTAKPAFQPLPPLLACHAKEAQQPLVNQTLHTSPEADFMEHIHQDGNQELIDGVANMETNYDRSSEDSHAQDESDIGKKKWRIEEDSAADGAMADYSLYNSREIELDTRNMENAETIADYPGPTAQSVNASYAEHVIEPTLVMFEVEIIVCLDMAYEPALRRGDSVYLVGLSRSLQPTSRKSFVTNPCAALNIGSADCPRYRAINMEVIELDTDFGSAFSGVLTDERGRVQAIWGSFSTQLKYVCNSSEDHQFVRGIPIYTISQVVEKFVSSTKGPALLINGVKRPMPHVRILEVELYPTLLSKARSFGLSDEWIRALVKKDPLRRQVLRVKGCLAGSKAENLLEQGDMVLAINKEPVTCFRDVENACQALDKNDNDNDGRLNMTIFRQGREIDLIVGTDVRDGNGTTLVINWCGCIVQGPHPAVCALGFLPEEGHGVYVARWCHGSPVHRYGLYALQWIVEVNGKPTPDMDAFVNVTKELEHGQFVRVRTVHLNGKPRVLTLKQDLHYWPTWEPRFDPDTATWRRKTIRAL
ncbi:hypothetical protein SAY86_015195 [Trapa natans]|uniref:PDZ domain-containing protein n=1 Tax=Trapa natans TaxID=22666 RepID=A0AAN7KIV6_TRANT|nr:hypothetical protein SAY86_015195 [Trapa natans]